MALRMSLLSTAGFVTLVLAAAGALQLIPEQPMSARINPVVSPLVFGSGLRTQTALLTDEPQDYTLTQRFSLENALGRIQQIRSALTSFRQLTESNQAEAKPVVGNTDWETQYLGFHNWVGSVEGTLQRQNYQIKELELELAKKQYQDKEITKAQLEQKQADYQKTKREFQTFLNSFKIAD